MKILFVCTGNTCRSPMAEGVLRKFLQQHAIADVTVESAGISAWPGAAASKFAVEAAKELGVDIEAHSSRQLSQAMLQDVDYVLTMTQQHADVVQRLAPEKDIRLLGDGITDPYGGDLGTYRVCIRQIQDAIAIFWVQEFPQNTEQ